MLLIDKYNPTLKKNIFFHKEIIELLKSMSKDEAVPHIIFYGPPGSGKKTMVRLFLEMLFDETVHKTKNVSYNVTGSGNKITQEKIVQSNYHIAIDPKNNNSDRYLIHDVVKEYAKRRTLGVFKTDRMFKVVLINNVDDMSYYAQTSLRRTMECYNDKCRFVMWCESLSKVIKPIQSRCIRLRIPSPSDEQLFEYILNVSIAEKINMTLDQYSRIIMKSNGNIKKALWELEYCRFGANEKIETGIVTNYDESISNIIKLILELKLSNVIPIRNVLFDLMITNFDGSMIMKDLIDAFCVCSEISDIAKCKIVSAGATFENQMVKGRREIIQFDALITSIIEILSNDSSRKKI